MPTLPPLLPLPCVIDVEASGFGRHSYPIEIGYVRGDCRADCMLVRPAVGWTHWDVSAERLHGISRSTLAAHGRGVAEVAATLNAALDGLTVYCDGWAHDYTWLATLFEAAQSRQRFRLESVHALLGEQGLARLDAERGAALAAMGLTRHRASNDARALQQAIARVTRQVPAPAGGA